MLWRLYLYQPQTNFKIIPAENSISLFQPLIVQDKALDDVVFQDFGCPDAELRGLIEVHPVADRNNGIEVAELHFPVDIPIPFFLNCFQNGNG